MQETTKPRRIENLIRKAERRLANIGRGVNIMDRDTMCRIITDAKANENDEQIRQKQYDINSEIRFRVHQQIGSITDFEKSNLVISLNENDEKHRDEIFKPFLDKGYSVTSLADFKPFEEYNVYLISWK